MRRFFKQILIFFGHSLLFLVLVWAFITYYADSRFDAICIEGRLSAEQAEVINDMEWGHCPSYRHGKCEAKENHRVFVGQCSEFTKFLWRPKKWVRTFKSGEFPWQY